RAAGRPAGRTAPGVPRAGGDPGRARTGRTGDRGPALGRRADRRLPALPARGDPTPAGRGADLPLRRGGTRRTGVDRPSPRPGTPCPPRTAAVHGAGGEEPGRRGAGNRPGLPAARELPAAAVVRGAVRGVGAAGAAA